MGQPGEITPPDRFYYSAAIGWMELGSPAEAGAEFDRISETFRNHPDVLDLEWMIRAAGHHWIDCVRIGEKLVGVAPDRPSGWIHRSFALHELKRTEEARAALLPAGELFPKEAIVPYNLACYAAQLQNRTEAWDWLRKAIAIGGLSRIKSMAMSDADLEPLRDEILRL